MSAVIESKHTPGPWEAMPIRLHLEWPEAYDVVHGDDHQILVNDVASEADAYLIAAAPDMYGALQVLREYFEETIAEHPPEAFRPVTLLRRAIAMAEGRDS